MPRSLWGCRRGKPVPVIDLFAGPGGLGEGFSRAGGGQLFRIVLSVEKEIHAHATLTLRAFQRALRASGITGVPQELVELMKGNLGLDELFAHYPDQARVAKTEALNVTLSAENRLDVFAIIADKLKESGSPGRWILIGGPPCQAYSIAGRARRSRALSEGTYRREDDERHFLYEEYLHIIAEFEPAVFVMENVKGLLSSQVGGGKIFTKILYDLESPRHSIAEKRGIRYRLYTLLPSENGNLNMYSADSFVVKTELFGVPQRRHRVIIVGIREDIVFNREKLYLEYKEAPTCADVLDCLPPVRSGLSQSKDSVNAWRDAIKNANWHKIILDGHGYRDSKETRKLFEAIVNAIEALELKGAGPEGRGATVLKLARSCSPRVLTWWYRSEKPNLVFNHVSKSHMERDLHRYFFSTIFAENREFSPKLGDFPESLLPAHANAKKSAASNNLFSDRFRVQMRNSVPTTVTSHIAKDGHGFIHYDSSQCRALTVREAARVQTFPDDYCFLGSRTAQYHQVGNAVPPYLAFQIAEAIARATGIEIG